MAKPQSADLDELLAGVKDGAPAAFSELYNSMADSLNSFAYSLLGDKGAAEDAVQQAFLELVQAAQTITGDGRSLRAWMYKSVRFRCLDEQRRRSRRPETLVAEIPDSSSTVPEFAGLEPAFEQALAELTPEQRSVLFLRHVVGLSGADVAKVVGSNRTAVFAMAARAERRLRRLLASAEAGVGPPEGEA